jgi:hypothetical protein
VSLLLVLTVQPVMTSAEAVNITVPSAMMVCGRLIAPPLFQSSLMVI